MTQKNSLKSFEMSIDRDYPRDSYSRVFFVRPMLAERTTLSLEIELTPETTDRVSLAISKAIGTPRAGFCTLRLDASATNQVALDGILNALVDGKVAKLDAKVKDLAGEKARLEARVLELEKALQEAAGAFETVEFLATKTDSDSAQTTIGEVASEWADKVFEAATKGESLCGKPKVITFDLESTIIRGMNLKKAR